MTKAFRSFRNLCSGLALLLGSASQTSAQIPATTPFGILNAVEIEPGVLSAGQPTAEQLKQLQAAGYQAVLDLRAGSEDRGFDEPGLAKRLGLAYENVPITLDTLDAAAVERFRTAYKSAARPLLLHCGSAQRTSALFYVYLVLDQELSPEAAMARAKAAGLKNPPYEAKVKALVTQGY